MSFIMEHTVTAHDDDDKPETVSHCVCMCVCEIFITKCDYGLEFESPSMASTS